jgi:group I intron endonuclease
MNKNSVYCFTNLINNKKYIGSTILPPKQRYTQHIYNSTHENSHQYNYPLYQAIRKYGINNFEFKVLESKRCSEQEIREIEKQYIIKYNTLTPNGYNQTLNTIHPLNDSISYIKMKETKREKAKEVVEINENKEIINHWRSIADCVEQEPELNAKKVAAVCRGERLTTCERVFRWLDNEKNIIEPVYKGDNYKGKQGTTQIQSSSKKVAKIDIETKQIIQVYPTIALAARENNCDASGISKVCRGIRNKAGGFNWKYI